MKNRQKGFAAVELLIVLVVLAVIGAIGWYVLSKNKDDETKTQDTTTSQTSETSDKNSDGYLEIPEWGIKLKTTHADKLTYVVKDGSTKLPHDDLNSADSMIVFSFKPEFVSDDSCKPGVDLYRLVSADDEYTKVGSRYYAFDGAPGSCSTDTEGDPADDDLKGDVLADLRGDNLSSL